MSRPAKPLQARITIMLGNSDADRSALEMLSVLTAETPAEIIGLFMEDVDLLALAELQVAREYCCLTHVDRQLNSADLQRQLRIQARSAQQALAAIAQRTGFTWSFQTVRGSLASLLQEALKEMDLMLLGARRRSLSLGGHFAPTTWTRASKQPVALIYDGTEASERALSVALRIARAGQHALSVFLVAVSADDFAPLRERCTESAGPLALRFQELVNPALSDILAAVSAERAGTLVVGINEGLISPNSVGLLRDYLNCPAILVK
jgi:nucleotide-binding universal stress UspA family protein